MSSNRRLEEASALKISSKTAPKGLSVLNDHFVRPETSAKRSLYSENDGTTPLGPIIDFSARKERRPPRNRFVARTPNDCGSKRAPRLRRLHRQGRATWKRQRRPELEVSLR